MTVGVGASIALNMLSSISVVLLNKLVYVRYGFPSMTLTLVHFAVTSLALHCCARLGVFSPKSLPLRDLLPLSASFRGFVVLTNPCCHEGAAYD